MINDILDFSKIEAGKLVLDREAFDLRESLGDTMKSFALARRISRAWSWPATSMPTCPAMVVGDYNRLRQIVVNLVGNAIKFTERGEVVLEVGLESLGRAGGRAALHGQRHGHRHSGRQAARRSSRCSSRPTAR